MKLILLNGPTGVGKTTVAEKLHQVMPTSFLLDLDRQRDFISQWQAHRDESRVLSFDIALAIAEACLKRGKDYICGKGFLDIIEGGREKNILDMFIDLGHQYHAEVFEIMLWADKEVALERALKRGFALKPTHTPEKDAEMWEFINTFRARRTNAILVDTNNLSPEEVFRKVRTVVGV